MFVQNHCVDVQAVPLCLSQDALMLSGEESTWRPLKEALPTLEALKEKSGILYHKQPQQPVCTERRPFTGVLWAGV